LDFQDRGMIKLTTDLNSEGLEARYNLTFNLQQFVTYFGILINLMLLFLQIEEVITLLDDLKLAHDMLESHLHKQHAENRAKLLETEQLGVDDKTAKKIKLNESRNFTKDISVSLNNVLTN